MVVMAVVVMAVVVLSGGKRHTTKQQRQQRRRQQQQRQQRRQRQQQRQTANHLTNNCVTIAKTTPSAQAKRIVLALEAQKAKEAVILKSRVTLCERGAILANVKALRLLPRRDFQNHLHALTSEGYIMPVLIQNKITELAEEDLLREVLEKTGDRRKELVITYATSLMPLPGSLLDIAESFDPFKPTFCCLVSEAQIADNRLKETSGFQCEDSDEETELTNWEAGG
jgi:type II secretory pathway pseudopilin PulG